MLLPSISRCLVFSVAILLAWRADALTVGFDVTAATASPGGTLSLDVLVLDLAGSAVGDFDLDIVFDPALLSPTGVDLADSLGDFALGEALDFSLGEFAPGSLNLAVVSTLEPTALAFLQGGSIVLASLEFTIATAPLGTTTGVGIAVHALGDANGSALPIDSTAGATLTLVPEPGTAMLLGLGLVALAAPRRRCHLRRATRPAPRTGARPAALR